MKVKNAWAAACLVLAIPVNAPASMEAGISAYEAGRYEEARDLFDEFVATRPEDPEGLVWLGRAQARSGDAESAVETLERATRLAPDSASAHFYLGNALGERINQVSVFSKMGVAKRMRQAFERAVKLEPGNVAAREALLQYYLQAPGIAGGGEDKAMEQARRVEEIDTVAGNVALAHIHLHHERFGEAIAAFEKALEENPSSPVALHGLGSTYQRTADWKKAIGVFERLVERHPENWYGWYQIGRTAVLSESFLEKGEAALNHFIDNAPPEEVPGPADALWRLGMLRELEKNPNAARAAYRRALEMDPDNERAARALAALD